ncbi:type II toxin-antitoxin system antitoxin, RelB/DinJ family [Eubacterium sp. 1001713B170207_170306_E7]|uniref:type II toxin-antitoxin system antitoxin, RelB/DinJ family n=1 Tax=Eubacterium sp. 1001713B170207_170306_E7 TaxID=2787097 RepID=UPI00189B6986
MARTSNIYIRLKQVALQRGIPFEMKLTKSVLLSYDSLTKEEFEAEIAKGMADVEAGRTHTAERIKEEMRRDYGP